MAQLDPLLKAVVDRKAEALVLAEGQKPVIQAGAVQRPVSQRALNREQIAHLVSELADQIDRQRIAAGESVSFNYRMSDGATFVCEGDLTRSPFEVRVRPETVSATLAPSGSAGGAIPLSVPPEAVPMSSAVDAPSSTELDGMVPTPPVVASPAPVPNQPAAPAAESAPAQPRYEMRPDAPPIDRLLLSMLERGSSDMHLISGDRPYYRVDGEMALQEAESRHESDEVYGLVEPIMPERNRDEFADTHDTDFAYEIPGAARFRTNVFMDRKGVGAVFRQIPSTILTAEQLGIPPAILSMCELQKGLVLVTGPTGSGKSTTLASMVDYINRTRADHIITIEDPIEFVHDNRRCLVNQREIVTHTDGFKKALRAALREDPDIVLVGELRDLETIAIAIETAETGHLVFGTLHTNTACSTVDRVIDQFPADRQAQIRTMLSESLKGVVAQTLCKRIGGGRCAALEILVVTPAIANLIREGKTFQIPSLMQTGKNIGQQTMNDALLQLVKDKKTEPDEAMRKSIDRAILKSALAKAGFKTQ